MSHSIIPPLGLGTFRLHGEHLMGAIHKALDLGYRHIDTAQFYENEETVGAAIDAHGIPRGEIFITTKIWHERLRRDDLIKSLQESLYRLRSDYIDLALIHWPSPDDRVPMEEYIAALLEAKEQGMVRHVGVSNFTVAQLQQARALPGGDQLITNQIEVHPFLSNRKVVEATKKAGMAATAYMPLAEGTVMDDPTLQAIGRKYGMTAAQVALAWLHDQGLVVIPSSTREAHLRANQEAMELRLSTEDIAAIETLNRNGRITNPTYAPRWDD